MFFSFLMGLCYLVHACTIDGDTDKFQSNSFLGSFSSKTAYRNSEITQKKYSTTNNDRCNLVYITSVFRHGTRFPSKDNMEDIVKVHEKILKSKGRLNLPDSFLKWKTPFSKERAKKLSSVGFEEMMKLGRRFRSRFEKIRGNINGTNKIAVFSSSVSRSKLSGSMFLHEFLQGQKSFKDAYDMILERDDLLRFFDNCQYYIDSVLKNKTSKEEYKRFYNGSEIKGVIKDVQTKWSLQDVDLTPDDVRSIFTICGYEIANNVSSDMLPYMCRFSSDRTEKICPYPGKSAPMQTSPLCSVLNREHYEIFEYLYDLKHYWTKAYGREINWIQSCALMNPMLEYIIEAAKGYEDALKSAYRSGKTVESHLNELNYLRGTFFFGHAETTLPLFALLNVFNQSTAMTAATYQERLGMINEPSELFKTFRVSNIAPFSGNLALELYHCPHHVRGGSDGYMVEMRSNEKKVKWSLAQGGNQASLEVLKQHLQVCSQHSYDHTDVCINGILPKL